MLQGQAKLPSDEQRDEYLIDYQVVVDNFMTKDTPTVKTKQLAND